MYFEFEEQPRHGTTWSPTIDVCERQNEIVIFVEMPGMDRSDVRLAWTEGVLIISGIKRQRPNEGATYICVERAYGHFRREIEIRIAAVTTGEPLREEQRTELEARRERAVPFVRPEDAGHPPEGPDRRG